MTAGWDEIKKLAADFQRTQLSDSVLKLSERNCIEIVRKLIKQNKLDVIFTSDGKEYLTPDHLLSEIENELYANNGRIYLYELSSILLVDISLIEQKAVELSKKSHGRINLVLGQLITNEYKDQLAVEINEKLQIKGNLTIAEIIKFCDLPPDFIQNVVNSRLRSIINGVQDSNNSQTYFTETYLDQFRSRIIGVLNAITRPTTINQILSTFKFPSKIFTTIAQELIKDQLIKGHFSSLSNNGTFIPETYSKIQKDYVESFLKQNHYIEYDALSRIGITDAKNYFKKSTDNLIALKSCLIDKLIYKQIESGVEEALNEEYLVDLYTLAPSVLDEDDFKVLIDRFSSNNNFILIGNYVISRKYLDKLKNEFNGLLKAKAEQELKDGLLVSYFIEKRDAKDKDGSQLLSKKEERRKQNANKSKSGGGTQGREVKIKSTKKKYNKKDDFPDDDDDMQSAQGAAGKLDALKFMDTNEIVKQLIGFCQQNDLSDELLEQIAEILEPVLNSWYTDIARDVYASSQTVSGSMIKKTHSELQNTTQQLYQNIFMSNKALDHVGGDLQTQLKKYLCKTLCVELINTLIGNSSTSDENNLSTTESRAKVIKKLDQELIDPFVKLNQSIASNDIVQLLQDAECVFEKLDLMIRKTDKRRETSILLENKHNLMKQLEEVNDDYAMILHLSVIILFNEAYKTMLHASGKFVPQLISQLKIRLDSSTFNLLFDCENLVMKQFRNEQDQENTDKLKELIVQVKTVASLLPKTIFVTS